MGTNKQMDRHDEDYSRFLQFFFIVVQFCNKYCELVCAQNKDNINNYGNIVYFPMFFFQKIGSIIR